MRVKNRKTIWNLSLKSFRASGKRNLIAVVAIVLTTVLFTSLFTIVMSLNESYQTYTFRQIGGYAHGTFKDVTDKQAEEIKGHKKVKAAGERVVAGIIAEGVFARVPAEVSYMDENNTKWSYIDLKEGREPEGEKEIILDDAALELLGVTPESWCRHAWAFGCAHGCPVRHGKFSSTFFEKVAGERGSAPFSRLAKCRWEGSQAAHAVMTWHI